MLRRKRRPFIKVEGKIVEGVTFDLEGTIVNIEPIHWAAHMEAAKYLGLSLYLNLEDLNDPRNTETFQRVPHFIGGPNEAIMRDLVSLAAEQNPERFPNDVDKEEATAAARKLDRAYFEERFRNLQPEEVRLRKGAVEFIEQLKARGIPVSIGSLTETEKARKLLQLSGLSEVFKADTIVLKEDVARTKPDPEVYLKTAERMGIIPQNQLVFEDSHNGAKAAKDAGSIAIGVPLVNQPEVVQRLKNEGVIRVLDNADTAWTEIAESVLGRSKEGVRARIEGQLRRTRIELESGMQRIRESVVFSRARKK